MKRSIDGSPAYVRSACEGVAATAGRRSHRPLLPAPRGPEHADRGHGRRDGGAASRRARSATSASRRRARETIRRAHAVHPITAVQSEYSLWTRDVEAGDPADAAGAGDRARRLLAARARASCRDASARRMSSTRATSAATGRASPARTCSRTSSSPSACKELAAEKGITPGQLALAWVLHRGEHIVPIPGTKRVSYLEENLAAADVELSAEEVERIAEGSPPPPASATTSTGCARSTSEARARSARPAVPLNSRRSRS